MILLSVLSFWIGAMLAQRFSIFAFAPATALVVTLGVLAGVSDPSSARSLISTAFAAGVSMQIGYFALGILIQREIIDRLSRKLSSPSETASVRHPAK